MATRDGTICWVTSLGLTTVAPGSGPVRAAVLMLHGGRDHSPDPVQRRHASWWRMALLQRAFAPAASAAGVAVELLRYGARGWNAGSGPEPSPVRDGRWALRELAARYGDVPVVLVGHSMGGRTACALADAPAVRGLVVLAPWLLPGEPVAPVRDQSVVMAHGLMDRWTSPRASLEWSLRARAGGARVARFELPMVGHFMVARTRDWNAVVRRGALGLLGLEPLPEVVSEAFAVTDGSAGGSAVREQVAAPDFGLRLPLRSL